MQNLEGEVGVWILFQKQLEELSFLFLAVLGLWIFVYIRQGFPGGSVVKNLFANAGDTGDVSSIPGPGKSLAGNVCVSGFLGGSEGKQSACNAVDPGSISGSRRFP